MEHLIEKILAMWEAAKDPERKAGGYKGWGTRWGISPAGAKKVLKALEKKGVIPKLEKQFKKTGEGKRSAYKWGSIEKIGRAYIKKHGIT